MALNNSQYDEILRGYERRQALHRHEKESRVQKIYAGFPRLRQIDEEVASTGVSSVRALLDGNPELSGKLKDRLSSLSRERQLILAQAGLSPADLALSYDCPDCQDTGFIDGQKCRCFKKAEIDLLYTQSNLRNILEEENFRHFSFDCYSPDEIDEKTGVSALDRAHTVYDACQQFLKNFDTAPGNLFLYGNTGVGKSFMTHCIARELLDTTHSVICFSAQTLFDEIAKIRFRQQSPDDLYIEYIYDCDLLIIDDLGTERTNALVTSELFLCLNERLQNRKATIISTNLPLDAFFSQYSERITSRISTNFTMLKLFGSDIRIKQKILKKNNPIPCEP